MTVELFPKPAELALFGQDTAPPKPQATAAALNADGGVEETKGEGAGGAEGTAMLPVGHGTAANALRENFQVGRV